MTTDELRNADSECRLLAARLLNAAKGIGMARNELEAVCREVSQWLEHGKLSEWQRIKLKSELDTAEGLLCQR